MNQPVKVLLWGAEVAKIQVQVPGVCKECARLGQDVFCLLLTTLYTNSMGTEAVLNWQCVSEIPLLQLLLYVGGLGISVKQETLELVDGIIMGVSQESSKVKDFEFSSLVLCPAFKLASVR